MIRRRFRRALLLAVFWCPGTQPAHAQPVAASAAEAVRPAGATNRLPAALADSTFWRLVTELSEPGGWFRSENYVSNETAWQSVIPSLARVVPAGHAYVGVGPEQNFTYLAALEPGIAFIVDIRRQNLALHLYYKALFELAETRAEFLSLLFARPLWGTSAAGGPLAADTTLSADALLQLVDASTMDSAEHVATRSRVLAQLTEHKGFVLNAEDRVLLERVADAFAEAGPEINYSYVPEYGPYTMVARGMPSFRTLFMQQDGAGVNRSFLGSEAAYQRVRAMQQRNLVVPVTGDFAGPHALRAVGDWLRAHDATVGTFYLSNVEQYLFQDNEIWPHFYENVGTLPLDASSTFIRSVSSRWGRGATSSGVWGPLMSQLIGPMMETVDAFHAGTVRWYGDVIALERP
jgi:hypothetical protein